MKARTQLASKPARHGRATASAGCAKVRGPAIGSFGNAAARTPLARAIDSHERQAHALADRFVAGDLHLGRLASAAPASRMPLACSIGRALPTGLRATLETAFEADLRDLRIHTDAAAGAVARALGANAFASGAHLVFAEGQFRPDTPRGRHLLAHEVTHALQQAGRAAAGGRLRVVEVDGDAPPQRDATAEVADLARRHAPPPKSATHVAYENLVLKLTALVAPGSGAPGFETWAAETVAQLKSLAWSWQAESLLYDVLKRHELYELAATMIDRDDFAGGPHIETFGFDENVTTVLEKRHGSWDVYALAIARVPWLQKYEKAWLARIESFAIADHDDPNAALANPEGGGTVGDQVSTLIRQINSGSAAVINEWMFNALMVLHDLDGNRRVTCQAIRDSLPRRRGVSAQETAALRAQGLMDWGKALPKAASTFVNVLQGHDAAAVGAGLAKYLASLGKRVATIGETARVVWRGNLSLEVASGRDAIEEAAELRDLRVVAAPLGLRTGLPALLARILDDLGRDGTDEKSKLDPTAWKQRADPWIPQLQALSEGELAKGRIEAFHSGKAIDVRAWIALDWYAKAVRNSLEGMRSPGEPKVAAWVQIRQDVAYWRIHLAGAALSISIALDWSVLKTAALKIVEARDETASVLAFRRFDDNQYFHRDPLIDWRLVEAARHDFNRKPIRGIEPFTLDTLALFYQAGFFNELARQIRRLLPTEDKTGKIVDSGAAPYLADQAQHAMKLFGHPPERWRGYGVVFAKKNIDDRRFADMFRASQPVKDLPHPENFEPVVPDGAVSDPRIWFIPPIVEIYDLVYDIPTLQGFVAAGFGNGVPIAEGMQRQRRLTREDWLAQLHRVLAEKMKDPQFVAKKLPDIISEIYGRVKDMYTRTAADHHDALLSAMRRDRPIVAGQIAMTFQEYLDKPGIPKPLHDAVGKIREFNRIVGAFDNMERRRQLGFLMLEVGAPMRDALARTDEIEIVAPMLGFALQGIETVRPMAKWDAKKLLPWLLPKDANEAWFIQRMPVLEKTLEHLSDVRAHEQNAQGYEANATTQLITPYVKLSKPLPVFTLLQPRDNGILGDPASDTYRITEIKHSFIYHPAYADAPIGDKDAPTGHAEAQLLEPDGKTPLRVPASEVLLEVDILQAREENGVKLVPIQWIVKDKLHVRHDDLYHLDRIANGTLWAGFVSAMETIESGIEGILNMFLDLIELLPGIGTAVAAARIGAAIAQFLASGEYSALVDTIHGGFIDIVKGVMDAITGKLDSQSIFLLLLFGDPRIDALLAKSTIGKGSSTDAPANPAPGSAPSRFGGLASLLHGFRRLGHGFAHAMREVDRYVEKPMQDLRISASTGPVLSFVLGFAADHIYEIDRISGLIANEVSGQAGSSGKTLEDLKKELAEQQHGFGDSVHAAMEAMAQFQLPRKIVDVEPVFLSVIEFAVNFVASKAGLVSRIIAVVLKDTGVFDYVLGGLAKEFVGSSADPNKYWQEDVLPRVEGDFNSARDSIVKGINRLFTTDDDGKTPHPFFKGVVDAVPGISPMKVGTDARVGFPETQTTWMPDADTKPLPSDDRSLVQRPAQVPSFGEGLPLPARARARFEQGTGQDMGHVRLHTGGVGDAMTAAFGADALTSGSHVFVRNGKLDATLDHELAHVLQQTGPRPLGRRHANAPVRGHPERGLDFRPESEAEASNVSAALRQGRRVGTPVKGSAGFQPTLNLDLFTVSNLLHHVSDLHTVVSTAKSKAASAVGGHLNKEIGDGVDRILKAVLDPTSGHWPNEGRFKSVHGEIGKRFKADPYAKLLATGARTVAAQAVQPEDKADDVPHYLAREEFKMHLEAMILAHAGILLDIKFKHATKVSHSGIDLDEPVVSVNVRHVHLPFIAGQSELWKRAVYNTWPDSRVNDALYKRLRRKLRPILDSFGTKAGVWSILEPKYKFGGMVEKLMEDSMKAADVNPVPWLNYVKTSESEPGIGLRFSTYDKDTAQSRPGRQSHHLVQYLVGQFFSNENESQPFRKARVYPGVIPASGSANTPLNKREVRRISPTAQGSTGIDVAKTSAKGRGGDMPTISLAAVTHQQGKLHISPQPDDTPGEAKSKSTQAGMLSKFFRDQLPELDAEPKPDGVAAFSGGRGKDTNKFAGPDGTFERWVAEAGGPDKVAEKIHGAVQATYREVEGHMSSQLESNMPGLEYQYYVGLVEETSHDIGPKSDKPETEEQKAFLHALQQIPAEAKKHNVKYLKPFGWDATS